MNGLSAQRRYDAPMSKVRIKVNIDEDVLRAVRVQAARTGKAASEIIENALAA
jgi:hypothetical protein